MDALFGADVERTVSNHLAHFTPQLRHKHAALTADGDGRDLSGAEGGHVITEVF
jgi:hypothetical protein